jgi:hypothetical protein
MPPRKIAPKKVLPIGKDQSTLKEFFEKPKREKIVRDIVADLVNEVVHKEEERVRAKALNLAPASHPPAGIAFIHADHSSALPPSTIALGKEEPMTIRININDVPETRLGPRLAPQIRTTYHANHQTDIPAPIDEALAKHDEKVKKEKAEQGQRTKQMRSLYNYEQPPIPTHTLGARADMKRKVMNMSLFPNLENKDFLLKGFEGR